LLRNTLILSLILTISVLANSPRDILPLDTLRITNTTFEKYSTDYILRNRGVLILENCVFKNNELGSKNSDAIFSSERVVSPIINYGKLYLYNCKFIGNYSWNTALSESLQAQAASGAIANFGELNISNVVFEDNVYQNGYFTIIRDGNIEQFSYIGNDSIYNRGNIIVKDTVLHQNTGLHLDIALTENPVKEKAEIIVNTSASARVDITITDAVGKAVFTLTDEKAAGSKVYTWNLRNTGGVKVSSGAYHLRVVAGNVSGAVFDALFIGVKE
jgi:hypothetical protein